MKQNLEFQSITFTISALLRSLCKSSFFVSIDSDNPLGRSIGAASFLPIQIFSHVYELKDIFSSSMKYACSSNDINEVHEGVVTKR